MTLRNGSCDQPGCKRTGNVIAKSLPQSGKWCYVCNNKRIASEKLAKGIVPKKYVYKREPTGEKELFDQLWSLRPHKSFIHGEDLGDEWEPYMFLHVLPKAKNRYPLFKLYAKNIVLGTWDDHYQWDNRPRSEIINDPKWKKMFDLESELKIEYQKLKQEKDAGQFKKQREPEQRSVSEIADQNQSSGLDSGTN